MQNAGRHLARAFLQELGIPQEKLTVFVTLGKQLLRSGTSVGTNYREGHRGRSKAEFIAKLGDSLRELEETPYWLELLVESEVFPELSLAEIMDETNQLTAIFVTIIKKAKKSMQ